MLTLFSVMTFEDFNLYLDESSQLNIYNASDADMNGTTSVGDFNFYLPNANVIGISAIRY